jgi:hypothetical protein
MSNYSSLNISEPEDLQKPRPFPHPWCAAYYGPRLDKGIGLWTLLCIIGGTVAAAAIAVAHHIVDTKFNNRPVDGLGFWKQNRTKSLEIVLAAAFKIVFCFSAGVSLCQIVRVLYGCPRSTCT